MTAARVPVGDDAPLGLSGLAHLLLGFLEDPPTSLEDSAAELLARRGCSDGSATALLEDDALVVAEAPMSCGVEEARAAVARVRAGNATTDALTSEAPRGTAARPQGRLLGCGMGDLGGASAAVGVAEALALYPRGAAVAPSRPPSLLPVRCTVARGG